MLEILDIQLHTIDLKTRMPFRYGIAEMTALPHVFLTLRARLGNVESSGIASDHLPPRWFTKNPKQTLEDEVAQMLRVIKQAARAAVGMKAEDAFRWWREAYDMQINWAQIEGIAPLLAHFGVTLVERALIHASAKAAGQRFHDHLLSGGLGFEPADVHPELDGFPWKTAFSPFPLSVVTARHTVGLADPLEDDDISPAERLEDGLPQSLAEAIRTYGLTQFKLKLNGDEAQDELRLDQTMRCLESNCRRSFAFSLDGNECFPSIEAFSEAWQRLSRLKSITRNLNRLLFIEQPVHRDRALEPSNDTPAARAIGSPVIIDESDSSIESLPLALRLGYQGTSHKNCKGVFKGLANKCLLAARESTSDRSQPYLLSGEDLSNIGPVALLQDLTVMASLGIRSIERNGHHYFRGLSGFPREINEAIAKSHPDLYFAMPQGYASLRIQDGRLSISSLARSAFGPGFDLDLNFAKPVPLATRQPKAPAK